MIKNGIMDELTQDLVQSLFNYKDGNLYWKVSNSNYIKIGDMAGSLTNGYYQISINNKLYKSHRLIFLYYYGYIPKEIDHIDRNRSNNKINNLREVTRSQNNMNQSKRQNTSSQYKGVTWDKQTQKWRVRISMDGKTKHLGRFEYEQTAALIYNKAAKELFKEYAKLNEVEL